MLPTPSNSPFANPAFAPLAPVEPLVVVEPWEPLKPMNAMTPEEAEEIAAYLRTLPEFQRLQQVVSPLPFPRQNAVPVYAPLERQNAMTEEECKAFAEMMKQGKRLVSPFAGIKAAAPQVVPEDENVPLLFAQPLQRCNAITPEEMAVLRSLP